MKSLSYFNNFYFKKHLFSYIELTAALEERPEPGNFALYMHSNAHDMHLNAYCVHLNAHNMHLNAHNM